MDIIRNLTGTGWGADPNTCCRILCPGLEAQCTYKVDTKLNQTMRIISRTVKSTALPWLPTRFNIAPPSIRRDAATAREFQKWLKRSCQVLQGPWNHMLYKCKPEPCTTYLKILYTSKIPRGIGRSDVVYTES